MTTETNDDLNGLQEPKRFKASWRELTAHTKAGVAGLLLCAGALLAGPVLISLLALVGAALLGVLAVIATLVASGAAVVLILGLASICLGIVSAPIDIVYSGITGYIRKGKKLVDASS